MLTHIEKRFGVIKEDDKDTYPIIVKIDVGCNLRNADKLLYKIRAWLLDNISAPYDQWATNRINLTDNVGYIVDFLFTTEECAMAFKLRWM